MYRNYINTKCGDLWFTMTIRNWCVMGKSRDDNLRAGPCVEVSLDDYNVCGFGSDYDEAMDRLIDTIGKYMDRNQKLPCRTRPAWYSRVWRDIKARRTLRRLIKEGLINPV